MCYHVVLLTHVQSCGHSHKSPPLALLTTTHVVYIPSKHEFPSYLAASSSSCTIFIGRSILKESIDSIMMMKTSFIRFTPCHTKPLISSMCTSTVYATTNGEDVSVSSDVAVFPTSTSVRKVTPKQLSVAVSKRKKLSRIGVEVKENNVEDKEVLEDPKTGNKKKKNTKPRRDNLRTWKLRYDKQTIPERDELVSHVSKTLGSQLSITRPFQDAYTAPSVIGMDKNDVDLCYEGLINAGLKKADAASILPYLPSCLVLDYGSIKEMCELLSENGIGWRSFIEHHCYCLCQPIDTVSRQGMSTVHKHMYMYMCFKLD